MPHDHPPAAQDAVTDPTEAILDQLRAGIAVQVIDHAFIPRDDTTAWLVDDTGMPVCTLSLDHRDIAPLISAIETGTQIGNQSIPREAA